MRGRGKNKYCMARNGDIGAYSASNVRIITNSENASESYDKTSAAERSNERRIYAGGSADISQNYLSPRMKEIWELRKNMMSAGDIAKQLGLKSSTVSTQLSNIKRRLGLTK